MTRIKICGLRKTDDALVAIDSGADFIGFVFIEGVRRQITLKQADVMISDIRRLRTTCPARLVGLFANQPVNHVNDVVKLCDLDLVQLCGRETIRYWSSIDVPVIKQVKVAKDQNPTMVELKVHKQVSKIVTHGQYAVLDGLKKGHLGGTGETFNWEIARQLSPKYDFLLAGGLSPDNVASAITTANPWGVDVSSGIETDGAKDSDKIISFINQVRLADSSL
jgi:phosphoribosylanthranilate isomerase